MVKLRVAVIRGGLSEEREVSLKSGQYVLDNLPHKYEAVDVVFNSLQDILSLKGRVDFAFIALHGKYGEDGYIQALLEMLKIPYSSAGVKASLVGMDKFLFKQVLKTEEISTIPDIVIDYTNNRVLRGNKLGYVEISSKYAMSTIVKNVQETLGFPVFIKPNMSGSSYGITKAKSKPELCTGIKYARKFGDKVLIEQAISGKELTVGFAGNNILPPILINPKKGEYFDYESKYSDGGAEEICPAPVDKSLIRRLEELTIAIKRAVGVDTYARVDYIYDETSDNLYPLEINTVPGMTPASLLPKAARTYGWSDAKLLDTIIQLGLNRRNTELDNTSVKKY